MTHLYRQRPGQGPRPASKRACLGSRHSAWCRRIHHQLVPLNMATRPSNRLSAPSSTEIELCPRLPAEVPVTSQAGLQQRLDLPQVYSRILLWWDTMVRLSCQRQLGSHSDCSLQQRGGPRCCRALWRISENTSFDFDNEQARSNEMTQRSTPRRSPAMVTARLMKEWKLTPPATGLSQLLEPGSSACCRLTRCSTSHIVLDALCRGQAGGERQSNRCVVQ